jgi:hypothetical protein
LAQHIQRSHTLLLQFSPHKDLELSLLGPGGAPAKRQRNNVTNQPTRLARPRHLETETCAVLCCIALCCHIPYAAVCQGRQNGSYAFQFQYLKYIYLCLRSGLLSCPAALITFFFLGLVTVPSNKALFCRTF